MKHLHIIFKNAYNLLLEGHLGHFAQFCHLTYGENDA